jgi:uncharacterized protein YciI
MINLVLESFYDTRGNSMLLIELTYKKPLTEVNAFLEEHRSFLDKYYAQRIFLASGPKEPRDGGVIIAMTDKKTIENIIPEDPFYRHDIADYRYIQFNPNKYCTEFETMLKG